jgi:flagellar hook protein FlgE
MSITNSLYIGVSGLTATGDAISVVGDNIANVSTIGYKRDRAGFSDVLGGALGAQRMGGGVRLAETETMYDQGAITQTGNPLDLAIRGNGFFSVRGNHDGQTGTFYSRDGRFSMDKTGYAVNQGGMRLQGYMIDSSGTRAVTPTDLQLGGVQSPGVASAKVTMNLNLDSNAVTPAAAWDPTTATTAGNTSNYATSATVYDSLGAPHPVQVYFRNNGGGAWEWHAMVDGSATAGGTAGTPVEIGNGTLTFNTNGGLQAQSSNPVGANFVNAAPGQAINFNFGNDIASGATGDGTAQQAGASTVNALSVDGRGVGHLTDISISPDGKITGAFDNGDRRDVAQVALTTFANQQGLTRSGDGLLAQTNDSGQPLTDIAAAGGRGALSSGALEASNVDLGTELVTLIAYQRAFQANAKTVTTADEMMNDINNLKR